MAFLKGIQGGLIILILLFVGYLLAYKEVITKEVQTAICKIVVNVSLPTMMISNIMSNFTKDDFIKYGLGILIPIVTIIVTYLIAEVTAKVMKIPKNRRGTFCAVFALSNTIFIGLPVSIALFGAESTPFALLYYIGNTTIFWTIGINGIKRDGGAENKNSLFKNIKNILTPPFMGFIAAVIFVLLGIKLPQFIMESCTYMGNLSTPLSIFFIGSSIYYSDLKKMKLNKEMAAVLIGRFVISPAIVYITMGFFNFPPIMNNVFVIQSAMPAITQSAIAANEYNQNGEYASLMVTVTTIVSMALIPVYMVLMR